jgi:hypothetical protein
VKIPRNWHDVRTASLNTGGRNDLPRPSPRARGGRTEMRSSVEPDVKSSSARSKRRAAGGRSGTKSKSVVMSGAPPRHRADRAPRGKKLASVGGSSGVSGLLTNPYIAVLPITPGHGAPNPPPVPQDQSAQSVNAFANLLGKVGSNQGSNNNQTPVDTGYAIYSNGTPVGIKGVAPFAGSAQDISSKRGGRVRGQRNRHKHQRGTIES